MNTPPLYRVPEIPCPVEDVIEPKDLAVYDHLKRLSIPDRSWADHIGIMLGNNCAVAFKPLEVITSPTAADNEPFAVRTKLGFAFYGLRSAKSRSKDRHLSNYISTLDVVVGKEGVANVEERSHAPSELVKPRFDDSPPVNSGPVNSGPVDSRPVGSGPFDSGTVNAHLGLPLSAESCSVDPRSIDYSPVVPCRILGSCFSAQNESFSCVEEFVPECASHLSDKCNTRDVCFGGRDMQRYFQELFRNRSDHYISKRTKIWFLKILNSYLTHNSTHDFDTMKRITVWNLKNFNFKVIPIGRNEMKLLVMIFTCLNVRASHVEIATSLGVSPFLHTCRCFVVRRSALMPPFNSVAPEKENKIFDEYLFKEHFEEIELLIFKFFKFKFEMLRFEVEYCYIDFLLSELKCQGKIILRSIGKLVLLVASD